MARGTKISQFLQAVIETLNGKEWHIPIIIKDGDKWENYRISSEDMDKYITSDIQSKNIYTDDGALSGARIVDLANNNLEFANSIDPETKLRQVIFTPSNNRMTFGSGAYIPTQLSQTETEAKAVLFAYSSTTLEVRNKRLTPNSTSTTFNTTNSIVLGQGAGSGECGTGGNILLGELAGVSLNYNATTANGANIIMGSRAGLYGNINGSFIAGRNCAREIKGGGYIDGGIIIGVGAYHNGATSGGAVTYPIMLGHASGGDSTGGSNSIYIGGNSGGRANGSTNVFIGAWAGYGVAGSYNIAIGNRNSNQWGASVSYSISIGNVRSTKSYQVNIGSTDTTEFNVYTSLLKIPNYSGTGVLNLNENKEVELLNKRRIRDSISTYYGYYSFPDYQNGDIFYYEPAQMYGNIQMYGLVPMTTPSVEILLPSLVNAKIEDCFFVNFMPAGGHIIFDVMTILQFVDYDYFSMDGTFSLAFENVDASYRIHNVNNKDLNALEHIKIRVNNSCELIIIL